MRTIPFLSLIALVAAALFIPNNVSAVVSIGGISFIDRNQTGEVVLGPVRGGLAVIDFDRDGYLDLAIGDQFGFASHLFRNVPDAARPGFRTFADVSAASGLVEPDGTARLSVGVLTADYDNDGDDDIFMVGRGAAPASYGLLYRNDGGTFTNVSIAAGVRLPGGNAEAASWCDFDLDGDVDLLVMGNAVPYATLLVNNGNGTFTDRSDLLPVVPSPAHFYSMIWTDYDGDGWPDCFPLNSSGAGHDTVLHSIPDGFGGRRFQNVADALGFVGLGNAPMGISAGDFDGDGDLDFGISDAIVGTYFRNDGGLFTHITPFSTMFGWGVIWLDVDNDRDVDFYTAGSWQNPNLDNLQRNDGGGAFANISPALNTVSLASQYAVRMDFNNDGRPDIITVNPLNSVSVFENVSTAANHWTLLTLRGDGVQVNRDAIGARVRLTSGGVTQLRELVSGSSTTATEDLRVHFGLGADAAIDRIEVVWPRSGSLASRTERFLGPIGVDQPLTLTPAASLLPGDLNCDGRVNGLDVEAFVLALQNPAAYAADYPTCNRSNGDLNLDNALSAADAGLLVTALLTAP
ncbi:MAG: FG-GAP-like repeat-containing protein [Phycisphaerae bacterium]